MRLSADFGFAAALLGSAGSALAWADPGSDSGRRIRVVAEDDFRLHDGLVSAVRHDLADGAAFFSL